MRTRDVLITLLAAVLLGACSVVGQPSGAPTGAASASIAPSIVSPAPVESAQATAIDQAFIDMMVPHHQSAIEMAKLAKAKAEHEELRGLADDVIAAQEREIGQLKGWRSTWFGSDVTPPMNAMPLMPGMDAGMGAHGMSGATMDMTVDIEKLRTANPFDRAFLTAMIAHHTSAIDAGKIALAQSTRPEVRGLADAIVNAQQAEIEQMQTWLTRWYPAG